MIKNNTLPGKDMTRTTHVPMRTCVVCRARKPKADLERYVCPANPEQGLQPDPGKKRPGRGFYTCKSPGCSGKLARFRGWRHKCKRGKDNDH